MFAGAEPPPVGGPPSLARTRTSSPSLPPRCPADPAVNSSPPGSRIEAADERRAAFDARRPAPGHMLFVSVVSEPESTSGALGKMFFMYVSPLGPLSPALLLLRSSDESLHA